MSPWIDLSRAVSTETSFETLSTMRLISRSILSATACFSASRFSTFGLLADRPQRHGPLGAPRAALVPLDLPLAPLRHRDALRHRCLRPTGPTMGRQNEGR